jgi:hypothetical protein
MPWDGSLSLRKPLCWVGLDTWTCITILFGATGMVIAGYLLSSKCCGILLGICGSIEMERPITRQTG